MIDSLIWYFIGPAIVRWIIGLFVGGILLGVVLAQICFRYSTKVIVNTLDTEGQTPT